LVDPEVVERRIREIDRRVSAARRVRNQGKDRFLQDLDLQAVAERHLQIAIQGAIDIAVHILAEDFPQTPEDYAGAFRMLGRVGVVDGALADRLAAAAGLRNVIVHLYLDVDPEQVWRSLEGLDDLLAFTGSIRDYLSRTAG
jgi:uncharacterized protein YutE (UPF0331/DUF86 family)